MTFDLVVAEVVAVDNTEVVGPMDGKVDAAEAVVVFVERDQQCHSRWPKCMDL